MAVRDRTVLLLVAAATVAQTGDDVFMVIAHVHTVLVHHEK